MSSYLNTTVHDASLNVLITNVDRVYICDTLPTNFTQASSTYKLGTKTGLTLTGPAAGSPDGRKATIPAITDGTVNSSGTAGWWAACSGSVLYAAGPLASPTAVNAAQGFTLDAVTITLRDPQQ